jgi:hypothetical protein
VTIVIECQTSFDITPTGVRNHHRSRQVPGEDDFGRRIENQADWIRSRNQQRNWDTVNQIISLRCLPENITPPEKTLQAQRTHWLFRFEISDPAAVASQQDPVGLLLADCRDVPMIVGLDEDADIGVVLDPGPDGNINFWVCHGK